MNNTLNSLAEDETALQFSNDQSAEWFEQIRSKDFKTALLKLDSLLNTNNSSVLERLWWIRCQLNLNLLPISTLVSPLEEIFPSILQSSEYRALAIATFFKTGKSLLDKNQSRLSLLMLERASTINEKHLILTEQFRQELQQTHLNVLECEIKNAQYKKESITYINELERKLALIKKDSEKRESRWTIKSEDVEESTEARTVAPKKPQIIAEEKYKNFDYKKVIFFIILLVVGYILYYSKSNSTEDLLAISLPLPELKPIDPNITFENKKSMLTGVEQRIASLGNASSSASSALSSSEIDAKALEEANKINVPQPTEEEELESISNTRTGEEQIPQTKIPQTKIPRLDPKTVGAPNVDTIDQSPRRAGVEPSLPDILNNEPRIPEGKTLDGKVLQPYEVDQFDPPLTFSTITATEVLSAPSLLSKSLARLEAGTHIYVTKKMGLWFEIRSTGGRIGYIYAQDAEQIKQR